MENYIVLPQDTNKVPRTLLLNLVKNKISLIEARQVKAALELSFGFTFTIFCKIEAENTTNETSS